MLRVERMSLHTHLCAVPLLDGNIPEQIHGQRLGATGIRQGNRWHIGHHACGLDSNSRSKVCVKYAGPMELWNDALVTPCEGQSRRRLSHLRLSANTEMLRTACFLYVIGHRELLVSGEILALLRRVKGTFAGVACLFRVEFDFYHHILAAAKHPKATP